MSDNTLIEEPKATEPTEEQKEKLDEYEQSAHYMQVLFTQFKRYGYELANRKKRAPIRVLEAFIFQGLHDTKLFGKEEQELLDLCQQSMYHKNKLVEYMLKRKQEKEKNDERTEKV